MLYNWQRCYRFNSWGQTVYALIVWPIFFFKRFSNFFTYTIKCTKIYSKSKIKIIDIFSVFLEACFHLQYRAATYSTEQSLAAQNSLLQCKDASHLFLCLCVDEAPFNEVVGKLRRCALEGMDLWPQLLPRELIEVHWVCRHGLKIIVRGINYRNNWFIN